MNLVILNNRELVAEYLCTIHSFNSVLLNVCVLVEYIIVVSYFPSELRFVGVGEDLKEIEPAHLGLKPHNILYLFLVVRTEEHGRVVLVLHEKLHLRLYQQGRCHHIGAVVRVQVVQEVTLVILRHVHSLRGSQDGALRDVVL